MMTVKFREPLSAQACVLVSSLISISSFPSNITLCLRKWMGDSSRVGESRLSYIRANNASSAEGPEMTSKEKGMRQRNNDWMTSLPG